MFLVRKEVFIIAILFIGTLSNSKLAGPLRIADFGILLVAALVFSNSTLRISRLLMVFIFFIIGLLSSISNFSNLTNPNAIVFYYKYAVYFISLFVISEYSSHIEKLSHVELNLLSDKSCVNIVRLLSIFHIGYIASFYFNNFGGILSGSTRVSLPFSSLDPNTSNAPAYSVVLGLIFVYLYQFKRSSMDLLLLLLLLCALLATGSRSGVVLLPLYIIFFKRPIIDRYLLWLTASLTGITILFFDKLDSLIVALVSRSLNFALGGDQSANDRLSKQISAIMETSDARLMVLGLGHENTAITWYDGIIGNLLVFGGMPALVLFCVIFFSAAGGLKPKERIYIILPLMISLISEFILTSYVVCTSMLLFMCAVGAEYGSKKILQT